MYVEGKKKTEKEYEDRKRSGVSVKYTRDRVK